MTPMIAMRTPLESGFVNCPACDAHVPCATINVHLDTDCAALGPAKKRARGPGRTKIVPVAEHVRTEESQSLTVQEDCKADSTDVCDTRTVCLPLQTSRESSAEPRAATHGIQSPAHTSTVASCPEPWWRPDDEKRIPVLWKKPGSTQKTPLTPLQMERQIPVEVVGRALPGDCASALLCCMLKDSEHWQRGSWWFAGLEQKAPRTSCLFDFQDEVPSHPLRVSACPVKQVPNIRQKQAGNSVQWSTYLTRKELLVALLCGHVCRFELNSKPHGSTAWLYRMAYRLLVPLLPCTSTAHQGGRCMEQVYKVCATYILTVHQKDGARWCCRDGLLVMRLLLTQATMTLDPRHSYADPPPASCCLPAP